VTGRGRRIDISLVEATAALFIEPLLAAQRGDVWGSRGNVHPEMAPHDLYRCGGDSASGGPGGSAPAEGGWGSDNPPKSNDDAWLAVAVRDDAEWGALCDVIGRRELARDPELATLTGRQARRDRLRAEIEPWTRVRRAEDAVAALQAAGIPAAPSHNAPELLADPHLRERGFFENDPEAPGGVLMRAFPPWRLNPAGAVRYGPAPRLGERAGTEVAAG
jgi:crotonobetainyl-CoA:carnitine CoA-transferase CaiB-like acyl-CoA transferase